MSTNRDMPSAAEANRALTVPQSSAPHGTFSRSLSGDKPLRIMHAMVRLRMETRTRDAEQPDVELQLASYAERLQAWPISDIERVLGDWPRRHQFWPTWAELEAELPELRPIRPALTYSAPEHAPMRASSEAEDHAPFGSRHQWDEFMAALNSLRNPSVPHIAREHLLAIGERMEARQRPHAVAMGWA